MIPRLRQVFSALAIALTVSTAMLGIHREERRIPHSRHASSEFSQIIPLPIDFEGASLVRSVELINEKLAQAKLKDPLKVMILKGRDPLPDGLHRIMPDFPVLDSAHLPRDMTDPFPPSPGTKSPIPPVAFGRVHESARALRQAAFP